MQVSLSLLVDLEAEDIERLLAFGERRGAPGQEGPSLTIPDAKLAELLDGDRAFSARIRRSLERSLFRGGRATTPVRGYAPWRALEPAIDELKELLQEAEGLARRAGGTPPPEMTERARSGFDDFCRLLDRELGSQAQVGSERRDQVGALVRRELHPYLLLTRIVERIYTKPRGYAGDYLTIRWMYENQTGGVGAAGRLLDAVFLERPAARAVRNRRELLAQEIRGAIERGGRVTSLACGPAEELFDVFASEDPRGLEVTCLDIDLEALDLVADRRDRQGLERRIRLEQANLLRLATGRAQLELEEQHLIYSIGLIDYFEDRFVVALLDWIHGRLAPGGRVVLGNFHPQNPDRALMDHVLDWRLVHRDEADMNRLFEQSKFAAPCSEIRFEAEGVNLFATGVK